MAGKRPGCKDRAVAKAELLKKTEKADEKNGRNCSGLCYI